MTIALTIVHVILSVLLIAIVLFQSGNQQGLSGSIGGAAETFFGKNKARTMDSRQRKNYYIRRKECKVCHMRFTTHETYAMDYTRAKAFIKH